MSDQHQAARDLQERLSSLHASIDQNNRSKRTRQVVVILLGLASVILCSVTFHRLYKQSRTFNASAVSEMGRAELQKRLPDAASAVAQHLKERAPELVHGGITEVVAVMPNARDWAFRGATSKFADLNATFERQITSEMSRAIHETHESVDRLHPDKTDEEKLRLLMESVTDRFERNLSVGLANLYPHYSTEMGRIRDAIAALQRRDPASLSPRERIVKDILMTMAHLTALESKGNVH